jgi:HK97 family phage major capsid protein
MTQAELQVLEGTYVAKCEEQNGLIAEVKQKADPAKNEKIRAMQPELDELKGKVDKAVAELKEAGHFDDLFEKNSSAIKDFRTPVNFQDPGNGSRQPEQKGRIIKSVGEIVTGSEGFKTFLQNQTTEKKFTMEIKDFQYKAPGNTITGAAGLPVFAQQTDILIPTATVIPTIMNYLLTFPMNSETYTYRRQTVHTSNAGANAENTTLGKSGFEAETVTATAKVIGHYLEVTEQQIADVPNFMNFLNTIARRMLDIEVEEQILQGDGTGANITGLYNQADILDYVRGTNLDSNGMAENNVDAIYRLLKAIRTTGRANPTLVAIHPDNWSPVRLLKDDNGNYIWGNPAETGGMRVWGVPVLETTSAVQDSAFAGDFATFCRAGIRQGIIMDLEKVGTNALNLLRTLTQYLRMGLEVYRATAFGTASNLSQ